MIKFINRETGTIEVETPPGEGFLKFLYQNPLGKIALHSFVKKKMLSAYYGRLMNSPSSTKKIQAFAEQLNINMDDAVKSINEFTSFNSFFYRKLKPEARPIQKGLVSPGDGKLLAFKTISDVNTFFIKGQEFTLKDYLKDETLTTKYKDAALLILRLAPNDYHRFHFPYSGHVSESTLINGAYFSVSPYALAKNFTRVFCENKRAHTTLTTKDKGSILLSPIGATMVGSIINTYTPNTTINKGDEMGYFAFGGSTILMLINSTKFSIATDILENTKNGLETFVKMGTSIGSDS